MLFSKRSQYVFCVLCLKQCLICADSVVSAADLGSSVLRMVRVKPGAGTLSRDVVMLQR